MQRLATLGQTQYLAIMASDRRVALVTGGAKRVGRAIVEKLAASDFDVAFTYLSSEPPAIGALTIRADLMDPKQIDAAASQVIGRFGRLDVLVNSASLYQQATLQKT